MMPSNGSIRMRRRAGKRGSPGAGPRASSVRDARRQAWLGEAGHLGPDQARSPNPEQRRYGDEEHHDAYAPEPLGHAAPEQDGGRLGLDVRK